MWRLAALTLFALGCATDPADLDPPQTPAEIDVPAREHARAPERRPPAVPREESPTLASLKWLARHQSPDGGWSVTGHPLLCDVVPKCDESRPREEPPEPEAPVPRVPPHVVGRGLDAYDVGVTALATLAFLGAGFSHRSEDTFDGICFGDVVLAGLTFLTHRQSADGLIGIARIRRYVLNHTLATLALSEAAGMDGPDALKERLQRAVEALLRLQNRDGGWGDTPGISDSFCTSWALLAFASVRLSEVPVDLLPSVTRGLAWLATCTDSTGRVGYRRPGIDGAGIPGVAPNAFRAPTTTALAMAARRMWTPRGGALETVPRVPETHGSGAAGLISWTSPYITHSKLPDALALYAYALAAFQFDGPDGPLWKRLNEPLKEAVVAHQSTRKDGCANGSWKPTDVWSPVGGRVYITAINTLTLEIYYRYANGFGGRRAK